MADTYTIVNGHNLKLIDNGDGTFSHAIKVTLDGSTKDLRGKAANKPAANSVAVGTTYWSIDTDPHADAVEVSNGTSWVVL